MEKHDVADDEVKPAPNLGVYCVLAGLIMAYGWGYRGTVGHEGGAMAPGALLGLVLCLGSGRLDWHRRSVVAGLFAAVGWSWGGSLSYMEQTLYALSDSFPDVLYGYTMLFFLGGLWAGIGGAVLGLALTEPRSELERLVRPFTAICVAFLIGYLYFFFVDDHKQAYETVTVRHFHDGDWLPALIALVVSGVYWVARPKDRPATNLFLAGSAAWWIGYLAFTKFGGLRLGPLHRSESWGGVVGILVVLILYLVKRQNRAALMLCLYGIVGGGIAFSLAVFVRHPLAVHWGPFQGAWNQWRTAEVTFGFFMALAIALGAVRLLRGGLAPPKEDTNRVPLDVYAVFVILVGLTWINFRRHAAPWLKISNASAAEPFLGIPAWGWYVFAGALVTSPLLYVLHRYLHGDRQFAPQTAFGKGVIVTLLLVWATVAGHAFHDIPDAVHITGHLLLWIPAALATWLLLSFTPSAAHAGVPVVATASPSDPKWRVGVKHKLCWGLVPLMLVCITALSLAMQDGSVGRKRFGPEAYWRQTARLLGVWQAVGQTNNLGNENMRTENQPVVELQFGPYRDVIATLPTGEKVTESHRWFLMNQYTWLHWYGKVDGHEEREQVPLQFHDQKLYIAWPPHTKNEGYLVFERVGD